MATHNLFSETDLYTEDIIYYTENVVQRKLKYHEKLLLNKLIKAKLSGEDLVFIPFIPKTLHDKELQCKYYGTNAKCIIIDDPDSK